MCNDWVWTKTKLNSLKRPINIRRKVNIINITEIQNTRLIHTDRTCSTGTHPRKTQTRRCYILPSPTEQPEPRSPILFCYWDQMNSNMKSGCHPSPNLDGLPWVHIHPPGTYATYFILLLGPIPTWKVDATITKLEWTTYMMPFSKWPAVKCNYVFAHNSASRMDRDKILVSKPMFFWMMNPIMTLQNP